MVGAFHTHSLMKTLHERNTDGRVPYRSIARALRAHGPTLAKIGALLAVAFLCGCASKPVGGDLDAWQYNNTTGFPAVGGGP